MRQPVDIGTEGIVVVDGVAAGVIGELSGARDTIQFTAILDYALLGDGSHVVELLFETQMASSREWVRRLSELSGEAMAPVIDVVNLYN